MKELTHLGGITVSPQQAHVFYYVRPDFEKGPWVAGGAIRQLLQCRTVKSDFDVYCSSQEQSKIIADRLTDAGFSVAFDSENAVTYRADDIDVQLIKKQWFQNPLDVVNDFDFAQAQLISDGYSAWGNPDWNEDDIDIVSYRPKSILKRLVKYYAYGYKIKQETLTKLSADSDLQYDFRNDPGY